jgi:hypothetical protein
MLEDTEKLLHEKIKYHQLALEKIKEIKLKCFYCMLNGDIWLGVILTVILGNSMMIYSYVTIRHVTWNKNRNRNRNKSEQSEQKVGMFQQVGTMFEHLNQNFRTSFRAFLFFFQCLKKNTKCQFGIKYISH